ncbi:unnamed protein product, partial [marine sediment metagenome]
HEIEWGKITPADLEPTDKIDLTELPKDDVVDKGAVEVAGAEEQKKQAEIAIKAEVEEKAAKEKAREEDILGILEEREKLPAEEIRLEKEAGLPAFQKERTAVQGQIAILSAEYRNLEAQQEAMTTAREGVPGFTLAEVSGQVSQIRREFRSRMNLKASEIAILRATESALSGNIIEARNQVEKAINIKYETNRLELDTQKFLLGIISADLTEAEQRQWDLQQDRVAREEQEMEEAKARDKEIQNYALAAIAAGAPQNVIDDIRNSTDIIEAATKAQPYLVEPIEEELL